MKKLIIVMPAIDYGGAQRFCLNFTRYLNKLNYDYEVVFLRKSKSKALKEEFDQYNIKYVEFNKKKASQSLFKLIKYLIKNKPQVILSTVENVDFITSIARLFVLNSKFIIRKANVIFNEQINLKTKLILRYESIVCNKLIALTEEMSNDYIKYGFKPNKIFVINNMVDLEYINLKKEENIINHEFNSISKDEFKLIANARMVKEKRYDVLIKAFKELNEMRDDVNLIILGNGEEFENIKEMIPLNLHEKIIFLGFQNNPYYFMSKSDIFLLTSDYEGFPNVIIEAFACNLPVISTNCKTGPKEIIDNNINGFVVNLQDFHEMAFKINELLNNKFKLIEMKINANKKAEEYTVEKIANAYLNIFDGKAIK